ncbi:sigma-70 family RNA polymerase sigma factor [Cupriavidus necator H16]|uniref:Sigma-70 family RNA polymerase sigma factor n=1 Tax=Cupriavidus necator (strain ATCC 17699 / DSM 428 / KCTC 22496 / NCIMB 10442 / H16 / Stanier 337) TaxID=381666 RepID=A0AAE6DJQ7_CUPNH|nr:sigma-70 family RNA polymerase sigma factor [Cupriavidus necator H16]
MPANRMTMRKIKEVLRLKWACGLSHRQIARATGVSVGEPPRFSWRPLGLSQADMACCSSWQ